MTTSKWQFMQRAFLVVTVFIMVACSWLPSLDSAANKQVDAGMKRALISFASARALNAVISVAQGTEVALEPGGLGAVFTPGQILDPVNDLVEQFSNLMLVASVAFGIQKLLISIGGYSTVSLVLSITAFVWALIYLRHKSSPAWLSRILVVLLMIRFAVPVVTIGSEMMFQKIMATGYQSSQQAIDSASGDLGKLNPPAVEPTAEPGIFDSMKSILSQDSSMTSRLKQLKELAAKSSENISARLSQVTNVGTRVDHLKQLAEQSTENIINLMAIFVLQTLVIPLLLIWVLYGVVRRTFEFPTKMLG